MVATGSWCFLREPRHGIARCLRPAAAADEQDRRPRGGEELSELRHLRRAGRGLDRRERRRVVDRDALDQKILGQAHDHRPRPAIGRGMKGARDDFRHAGRIVDLRRPFGHRAEHGAVIEFLKRLAFAHVARDLADEHHERRRILARDVNAGRGVGGARSAGDEAHARPAGHLAHRLRHHRRAAFLAAHRDGNRAVMERIERREVALAGDAKYVLDAMDAQLIDQNLGGGPCIVLAAHRRLLRAVFPWHYWAQK